MKKTLIHLLDLQRIDDKIDQLKENKRKYPQEISNLEAQVDSSRRELQEQSRRKEELRKQRRHFERELNRGNEELQRHKKRLKEVQTNKEYKALTKEIKAWENNVSGNETQVLRAMTELEELQGSIKVKTQSFEKEKKEKQEGIAKLKEKIASTEKSLRRYRQKRKEITQQMDRKTLSSYERIRKGKGGLAVASVWREACSGCYEQIPPQMIVEIKRNDRLITCENCGRILVWSEE